MAEEKEKVEEKDEVKSEEPKAVETPAPTGTAKKSSTGKKLLIGCGIGCGTLLIMVIIVTILIVAFAGSQVKLKDYVSQSTEMYNGSQKMLESASTENIVETKNNFVKIQTNSEQNLKELNETKVPDQAKQLKADMIEYFTITKKMAGGFVAVYDLLDKVDRVAKSFQGVTIDNSSFEAQANSLRSLKKTLDPIVIEVDSMTVPQEVATNHSTLKMYYRNFSTALDKAILGSDTKNSAVVVAAKADMTTALDGLGNAFNLDNLYKAETARATTLEKSIQDQINNLNK